MIHRPTTLSLFTERCAAATVRPGDVVTYPTLNGRRSAVVEAVDGDTITLQSIFYRYPTGAWVNVRHEIPASVLTILGASGERPNIRLDPEIIGEC